MAKEKTEAKEYGHLTKAIQGLGSDAPERSSDKEMTPMLDISARVSMGGGIQEDKSYKKQEMARLKKEIKGVEAMLSNWDAEEVSNKAQKSLKTDLAVKRARLMECEAMLGDDDDPGKGKGKMKRRKVA